MHKAPIIVDPRGKPRRMGFLTNVEAKTRCAEMNERLRDSAPDVVGDYYRVEPCTAETLSIDDVIEFVRTSMTDSERVRLIESLEAQ